MASIEKRSDNTYRITVSCGYDSKGKKLFKKKTVSLEPTLTEKQREKKLNELTVLFERDVQNGTFLDGDKITFEEFANKWLLDYAEPNLAPKTLARYKELLKRINICVGHIKLSKLQPHNLVEFYNNLSEKGIRLDLKYKVNDEIIPQLKANKSNIAKICGINSRTLSEIMRGGLTTQGTAEKISSALNMPLEKGFAAADLEKGLSAKTILHHHRLISSVLNTAVQWQLITSNVAERVKPPKVEKKEASHYDDNAVIKMFSLLSKEPLKYQAAIYIALYGGLRLGEVTGLDWSDVDFNKGVIDISKTSQYLPDKGVYEKTTKNATSIRKIILSDTALQVLRLYKAEQSAERLKLGNIWIDSGKVFVQWNGVPMFPSTPSAWFRKWLKTNDMPHLTFHQLRHTNASLLISQGVDIATVSKRLGHSKISTTIDIYTHAISKLDGTAAETLDSLLGNKYSLTVDN